MEILKGGSLESKIYISSKLSYDTRAADLRTAPLNCQAQSYLLSRIKVVPLNSHKGAQWANISTAIYNNIVNEFMRHAFSSCFANYYLFHGTSTVHISVY